MRGEPEGLRLRTGAPAEDTAGRKVEGGGNQVGIVNLYSIRYKYTTSTHRN